MSELPSSGDLDPCSRHHTAEHAYTLNYEEPYKVPRQFFVVDELPKSMIGKVLRRQVKQTILEQLGS